MPENKHKTMLNIFWYAIIAILVFFALICASVFVQHIANPDKIPSIFGYKPFIVLSGSMESEINKGDLVVTQVVEPSSLKEDDIIAFRDEEGHVVTHRIVGITQEGSFSTKGDNNNTNDQNAVEPSAVEGKYLYKMNGVGNLVLMMQEPITIVVVMVVIITGGVLWILSGKNKLSKEERKELEKLRREKNRKGGQMEEDTSGGGDEVK